MGKGGNPEPLSLGVAFSQPKRHPRGRPTKTAAALWPPPLGPGAPLEEDKWLALGETRWAATLCKTACGLGTVEPLPLAKGPDGTKGFKLHRTARGEPPAVAWGPGRLWDAFWNRPISPTAFALTIVSGSLLLLLVLVYFFRLAITTAVLVWAVNRFGWLKRLCQHALKLGLASGGLVLTCSVMDMGATLLGYTTALLVELTEPQIKLAILGGATAFLLVIAAPEGGSSNRVLHENLVIFSLHPPRSASSSPLAIHQEAGRLRRRVAATLFFRVFDPGGLLCFISSCFCHRCRSTEHQRLRFVLIMLYAPSLASICGHRCRVWS